MLVAIAVMICVVAIVQQGLIVYLVRTYRETVAEFTAAERTMLNGALERAGLPPRVGQGTAPEPASSEYRDEAGFTHLSDGRILDPEGRHVPTEAREAMMSG